MAKRYPVYAEADIRVESADGPPEQTVQRAIDGLARFAAAEGRAA
jgi:shikimate kinase